jgi:hypothetical protein
MRAQPRAVVVDIDLAWTHASFESDSGGVVRQWADWVEVCTASEQLPASDPAGQLLLIG